MVVLRPPHFLSSPISCYLQSTSSVEMVTTCTYRPSLVKIDARNFELSGNRHRPAPARCKPTDRTITIHCAAKLSAFQDSFVFFQ